MHASYGEARRFTAFTHGGMVWYRIALYEYGISYLIATLWHTDGWWFWSERCQGLGGGHGWKRITWIEHGWQAL